MAWEAEAGDDLDLAHPIRHAMLPEQSPHLRPLVEQDVSRLVAPAVEHILPLTSMNDALPHQKVENVMQALRIEHGSSGATATG